MTRGVIMLAAGGTGGHLFPAFALAEELRRRDITVDLVTEERGDRYGSDFPARAVHRIPSATLASRSPIAAARTVGALASGVRRAFALLGEVKPRAVIGFGGYPTFPPLVAAYLRGIPTAVHEQNAVMGRANRMLASRVTRIAASFDGTRLVPAAAAGKVVVTGNPVRDAVINWSRRNYEPPRPGGQINLVIFGGSQGARFLSDTVPAALALAPDDVKRRLRVVQQCRDEDLARVGEAYRAGGIAAELSPFFRNLPELIANAHLVIGRAGASTVAELMVLGRPAILVPLPHSLDNDQLNNAQRLAEAGGGWCVEQKSVTAHSLAELIEGIIDGPHRLSEAAAAAKALGRPDAVARLADLVVGISGL